MASRDGILLATTAITMVAGVTWLQGHWTERWAKRDTRALEIAADRLERSFPDTCGSWKLMRRLEMNPAELERAGAEGSISREYLNENTKTTVSAFIVCALPHNATGHTPDRCYPGAGFEIEEPEHGEKIELPDGRIAEVFTGTFTKPNPKQTLRIYWTYGVMKERPADETDPDAPAAPPELVWLAPPVARTALAGYPAVYKLYAIINQSGMSSDKSIQECRGFLTEALPAFEAALHEDIARDTTRPAVAAGTETDDAN